MDNRKSAERQRVHFNNITESYDKAINDDKAVYYRYLVYKRFFKGTSVQKKMRSGRQVSVLEAMCGLGSGRLVLESIFDNPDIDYEGFDYSDEIVAKAHQINPPELKFYKQDVNTFHSEKKYDIVMLLSGLHHVPNSAGEVMKKLADCIKTGGVHDQYRTDI